MARKITQQEIADRLHITQTSYSQFEAGNRKIDIERLKELAHIFDVSIDSFFRNKKRIK